MSSFSPFIFDFLYYSILQLRNRLKTINTQENSQEDRILYEIQKLRRHYNKDTRIHY